MLSRTSNFRSNRQIWTSSLNSSTIIDTGKSIMDTSKNIIDTSKNVAIDASIDQLIDTFKITERKMIEKTQGNYNVEVVLNMGLMSIKISTNNE